ncbi:MAG TPA: tetratricopeptide repeat protein, partial [Bacillota bacterium]|nr:tetratricopeptide repeat protein [Bacillota bacterium]
EYRQKTSSEQDAFERVAGGYNQALNLMQHAQYAQAVRILRQTLKAGPQYLPALELLVLAYYHQKKYRRCWRVINRIRKVTVDAPVLVQIAPDLLQKVSKLRLAYGVVLFLAAFGVFGYVNHQITATEIQPKVKVVTIERPSPSPGIDRQLLQATANRLSQQGDYLAAADILLALYTQKERDITLTPAENLIFEKAAARYYFNGMRQLRRGLYSEAAVEFSLSLRFPVRSYVYDDTLYYQALSRERLGLADRAVVLYRQLIEEEPDSTYCRSAVIRWGWLAENHPGLRKEFVALVKEYPIYAELIEHRLAAWEE